MQRAYKARGVVLRGRSLGEADRILTLFTLEHGKIDAVAKGIRRAKSRLAGRLEFGNEVQLTMHRGRSLDVVVTADIVSEHWSAIVEPARFAVASVAGEVIDAFCEPELALPDVYALLVGMLGATAASSEPAVLLPRFSMRLLEALGLAPPIDLCVRCGKPLGDTRVWLDAEAGGLIDDSCRERWRVLPELEATDLENLRALATPRSTEGRAAALRAKPKVADAISLLVMHHLGRRPKSEVALQELHRR